MISLLGIDLTGREVLVVGGGPVAARRAQAWADGGAQLRVVAPQVVPELGALLARAGEWHERAVREEDLEGVWLVLAATDDPEVNRAVAAWAQARRVWCVVADEATVGSARTPATTRSGDLTVGVVSDGHPDPRRVATVRDVLAERLRSGLDQRRRRAGGGTVTLVGGGPGAVDLLTIRGRRALAEADVVITDRLGPVDVLAELPPDVEIIDVGKAPGNHHTPQPAINALLIEHARRGRHVVRLKGGDPFVFGRGGEEVEACAAAGIPVDVIPGISSALSAPALAGVPLTHRGTVAAFHVIAGHAGLDDVSLACVRDRAATLVILMGVSQLDRIATQALTAGADPLLPVAVVENGSTPEQRVTRAPLRDIAARAAAVGVRTPAVIVIGDVAADRPAAAAVA